MCNVFLGVIKNKARQQKKQQLCSSSN